MSLNKWRITYHLLNMGWMKTSCHVVYWEGRRRFRDKERYPRKFWSIESTTKDNQGYLKHLNTSIRMQYVLSNRLWASKRSPKMLRILVKLSTGLKGPLCFQSGLQGLRRAQWKTKDLKRSLKEFNSIKCVWKLVLICNKDLDHEY